MRTIRTNLLVLVAVVATAAAASLATAGVLAPSKASDAVTLKWDGATGCISGLVDASQRLLPDGSQSAFAIPEGRVLVVTSGHFTVSGGDPGAIVLPQLEVNGAGVPIEVLVALDGGGRGYASFQVPPGIVIRSTNLRTRVLLGRGCAFPTLHGFFAKDR